MSRRYQGDNPQYNDDEESIRIDTDALPEAAPPVSGRVELAIPSGVTVRGSLTRQLCRWTTDDRLARPLVLLVDVSGPASNSPASPYASQLVLLGQSGGNAQGLGTETGGVLRVTYGQGNTVRVLEADLRSGTYQLPACSTCTVEAFLWLNGPASCVVAASIIPGRTDAGSRFVHSFRSTLAAGASVTEKVPFGARWMALAGGAATALGAAGQPQLLLSQGASGPVIVHDYVSGSFLAAPNDGVELSSRSDVTLKNNGTAQVSATVRFLLET